jgi:hypothetical protein
VSVSATVISEPTDAAVQRGIKAWLADRRGQFPRTHLCFDFSGTANITTPLLPDDSGPIQGARWHGLGKRNTVLRWVNPDVPFLSSYGQLRNWRFDDITVQSGVPNAKGFYLRSDNQSTNQDGGFTDIECMGSWEYFIGLDGMDSTANLNSEIFFDRVAMSNDASFSRAWFWCGMTPGVAQQNQFLNYSFRNTKLEGSHGDYLRLDYGGSVQVDGFNSWLHTGHAAGDKIPRGRMIYLPRGGNGDSVMFLHVCGLRPELRSVNSKLLDSAWSSASVIKFDVLRSAGNAFRVPDFESIALRGDARLLIDGGHLAGHIGLWGTAKPTVILEGVKAAGKQGIDHTKFTDPNGNGIVRTYGANASPINVKIR